ncbi:MAG: hypothetical protein IT384_08800 [Deltaproteobacteria bacterium]|nr:hypothetical protein [Deltaproteobacteria bacterium]
MPRGEARGLASPLLRVAPILLVALTLPACPSTDATTVRIDSATPIPAVPEPPTFKLDVRGHGFGLRGVRFDMSQGHGATDDGPLRVEIVNRRGLSAAEVESTRTTLLSTTQLEVVVTLAAPLPPDTYGVRLYENAGPTPSAELPTAFEVGSNGPRADAGPGDAGPRDAGPAIDGSEPDGAGASDGGGSSDAAMFYDASGSSDAAPGDAELGDAGPGDSGLGSFLGAFGYRQRILLQNNSGSEAAAGVTFRLRVPHQALVTAGRSRGDGADLAVALDGQLLPHAFEDALAVGGPELILIVRLPVPVPAGAPSLALALYYGDPNRALSLSDSVFEFSERFSNPLPATWLDAWLLRCHDRGLGAAQPTGTVCITDASDSNPVRRTLGSPNVAALRSTGTANEIYELVAFVGGVMQEANSDLLHFAYSSNNTNFAASAAVPSTSYLDFPPNAQLSVLEGTGVVRTIEGWRFATDQPFTKTRARFRPTAYDQPSLHFRYVSANGTNPGGTLVGVDDVTVRRAVEPDLGVTLDPSVETP